MSPSTPTSLLRDIAIIGTGKCLPQFPITNKRLIAATNLDVDLDWVDRKIGIETRYTVREIPEGIADEDIDPHHWNNNQRCAPGCLNSDMAADAARKAIQMAGISKDEITMIVHSTCTPDYPVPATSTFIQEKLDIPDCQILDIRSACCGSTMAINTALQYLASGTHDTILVTAAEAGTVFGNIDVDSPHYQKKDLVNAFLIGDGAGAVVLRAWNKGPRSKAADYCQIEYCNMSSIGVGKEMGMWLPAGGCVYPCTQATIDAGQHYFKHDFKNVFKHGADLYLQGLNACLADTKLNFADINMFVPHQANGKVKEIGERLGAPEDTIYFNFPQVGNTANASLLICMDEIVRGRKCPEDGRILLLAAESTKWLWGSTLIKYKHICPTDQLDEGAAGVDKVAHKVTAVTRAVTNMRLYWLQGLLFLNRFDQARRENAAKAYFMLAFWTALYASVVWYLVSTAPSLAQALNFVAALGNKAGIDVVELVGSTGFDLKAYM